jgi:hypothetical protein
MYTAFCSCGNWQTLKIFFDWSKGSAIFLRDFVFSSLH